MLKGKKILLGITGSIAAYKAILLTRYLIKDGCEVKVLLTIAAKEFVSPLVLSTLSKNEVFSALATDNQWANHVELGRWADVFLIAPLSCNTLAKLANGLCDNLLLATYLSATCPIVLSPAMDEDMWLHPATKRNIDIVKQFGNYVINVNSGELASGLFGEGRMAEPEEIIDFLKSKVFRGSNLSGLNVLITAGPTYEALDPVRFIGNHSSGKMGFALADAAFMEGANVTLVTGPTNQSTSFAEIERIDVVSAKEMFDVCMARFSSIDVGIMSAAVADYTPIFVSSDKVKKKEDSWNIELTKTKDILFELGLIKRNNQFLMGFALETNNELENAQAKLSRKNADCIVLNTLKDKEAGFGFDTNKITILHKSGSIHNFELKSKTEVAIDIISFIHLNLNNE